MPNEITYEQMKDAIFHTLPREDVASDYTSTSMYIRRTPETEELVEGYEQAWMVETFWNNVEGGIWYEIPFMKASCC